MVKFTNEEKVTLESFGFYRSSQGDTFYRDFSEISEEITKRGNEFHLLEYNYDHEAGDYKPHRTSSTDLLLLLKYFERL